MKPVISFILTSCRDSQRVINTISDLVSLSKDYNTEILVASNSIIDFGECSPIKKKLLLAPAVAEALEDWDEVVVQDTKSEQVTEVDFNRPSNVVAGPVYEEEVTVLPKIDFKNVEVRQYLNKDCSGEGLGIFPESSVRCFNFLANQAAADWVVLAVDDHMIIGDLSGLLETLTVENGTLSPFYNRKYKIGTLKGYPGSTPMCPGTIRTPKGSPIPCQAYICRWPIFHKSILKEFGGVLFNQSFYHHFCDNWISYWVHQQGEYIPILYDFEMHHRDTLVNESNPGYDDIMFRTLVEYRNMGKNDYNMHVTKPVELTILPDFFKPHVGIDMACYTSSL